MIHSNSLPGKNLVSQQIVRGDILDKICKQVKEAADGCQRYIFIDLYQHELTKATEQILALYGYRIEHQAGCYCIIRW